MSFKISIGEENARADSSPFKCRGRNTSLGGLTFLKTKTLDIKLAIRNVGQKITAIIARHTLINYFNGLNMKY